MKLSELTKALDNAAFMQVDLMRNPADLGEWVMWVRDDSGKSYLLCDDTNKAIANRDLDQLIVLLRAAGLKKAGITL